MPPSFLNPMTQASSPAPVAEALKHELPSLPEEPPAPPTSIPLSARRANRITTASVSVGNVEEEDHKQGHISEKPFKAQLALYKPPGSTDGAAARHGIVSSAFQLCVA
jgi:hypothetical protein